MKYERACVCVFVWVRWDNRVEIGFTHFVFVFLSAWCGEQIPFITLGVKFPDMSSLEDKSLF